MIRPKPHELLYILLTLVPENLMPEIARYNRPGNSKSGQEFTVGEVLDQISEWDLDHLVRKRGPDIFLVAEIYTV